MNKFGNDECAKMLVQATHQGMLTGNASREPLMSPDPQISEQLQSPEPEMAQNNIMDFTA
jgi:hypothetical protein